MCVFVYVWYIHLYMHGCLCDTPIPTYGCVYEISWWQWWLVWACNVCQYVCVTDIMCVSLSLCTQCVYAYTYVCPYYTACIYSPRWRRCLLVWAKSSSCPLAAAGGGRAASARVCAASKTGKVRPRERSDLCCWCFLWTELWCSWQLWTERRGYHGSWRGQRRLSTTRWGSRRWNNYLYFFFLQFSVSLFVFVSVIWFVIVLKPKYNNITRNKMKLQKQNLHVKRNYCFNWIF